MYVWKLGKGCNALAASGRRFHILSQGSEYPIYATFLLVAWLGVSSDPTQCTRNAETTYFQIVVIVEGGCTTELEECIMHRACSKENSRLHILTERFPSQLLWPEKCWWPFFSHRPEIVLFSVIFFNIFKNKTPNFCLHFSCLSVKNLMTFFSSQHRF